MANKFKIENLSSTTISATYDDLTIFERAGRTYKIGAIDFTSFKFDNYGINLNSMSGVMPNTVSYIKYDVNNTSNVTLQSLGLLDVTENCAKRYIIVIDRQNDHNHNNWYMPFQTNIKPASSKNADYLCVYGKINIFDIQQLLPETLIVNGQSI